MSDKFTTAVEELGAAISAGEDIETAIAEIAAEHDVRPVALRNRAERSLGDLTTYRERHNTVASDLAQAARERQETEKRREAFVALMHERGWTSYTMKDAISHDEFLAHTSRDSETDRARAQLEAWQQAQLKGLRGED